MMHAGTGGVPGMAYYSYSNQNSPVVETASKENPFEGFPTVTIPPRLKNIGRKISQMSNDFLDEDNSSSSRIQASSNNVSPNLEIKSIEEVEVPGMGDEPVMCPFCNKPLPPSLLASQLTSTSAKHAHNHNHQQQPSRPSNLRRASSMRATSSPSPRMTPTAPLSRVPSANTPPLATAQRSQSLLDPLPVKTPEGKVIEPDLPSATSESFAETVKEGDVANHDAAEKMITDEELKRWSTLSGIALQPKTTSEPSATPGTSTPTAVPAVKPVEEKRAFPLLPPPPPAASKLTKPPPGQSDRPSSSSSKFGFFGGAKKENNDDEESDDDNVATGYTQLTGPASDSEDEDSTNKHTERKTEAEKKELEIVEKEDNDIEEKPKDTSSPVSTYSEVDEKKTSAVEESKADPEEVKKVLQEVLNRVNDLSKSQSALLASHSTLLTSLKIARSNLAMAEANSEMLEAQLKRTTATSASSRTGTSTRNVSGPATTPGTPQLVAPAPRASADHVRATTTANTTATPASAIRTPARASMEERQRPTSLYITANELANAGGASAPSSSGGLTSSTSNSWGFWNGGKKKVTGALSHVHVPSASSMIDAFQPPTRPGTPNPDGSAPRKSTESISSWIPTSPAAPYSVPVGSATTPAAGRPQPNRTITHQANLSKSFNEQPSLSRSMSVMNVAGQRSVSTSATTNAASTSVTNAELSKLRQAYSAAVAKMDGMSKELAELKKGKIEMEAELENLSQALFEEANKMVADERRKRSELEESLKEVKDEREALRDTIKVLGGKVDEPSSTTGDDQKEKKDDTGDKKDDDDDEEDFQPRDLDKHYAALRKSIHHVAIGADLTDDEDDDNDDEERTVSIPLVSEPTSFTPSSGLNIPSKSSITSNNTNSGLSESQDDNDSFGNQQVLSMSMPSLPAPLPLPIFTESNPWANDNSNSKAQTSPITTYSPPRINVKAATPSPHIPPAGLPDLPNDQAGEGEATTGLGLDLDKGVVEGQRDDNADKK